MEVEAASTSWVERSIYSGLVPDGDQARQAKGGDGPSRFRTPEHERDYRMIRDWWQKARTDQAAGRYEQAIDDDFYDGLQWADSDRAVIEGRGQPALVFNMIKPVIDWIIGTQKRTKFDWHIYPRTDDDRKPAEVKTKLLKYTDDVNHAQFHRSRAFADTARVGIGWLEDGVRGDPTKEPLYTRSESWRNIWYDHLATEPDMSDARYLFRSRWADVDVAVAYFPDAEGMIKAAARAHDLYGATDDDDLDVQLYYRVDSTGRAITSSTYTEDVSGQVGNRRERVRLVECWYRKAVARQVVRVHDQLAPEYTQADGQVFEPEQHQGMVQEGLASVYNAIRMEVWCAIFVEGGLLSNAPSPYKHDRFPFTPIWGYRRKRDGACYGAIRNQRDPQEDMNKRLSKAQHILNTSQVIAEEGAVDDIDEAREEVAAPDGWITVKRNKRFEITRDNAVAAQHIEIANMNRQMIREAGGVTTENLGHETNATSGKAIEARQNEGAVVTTELFDNFAFALQLQGEIRLSLIEQYYSAPKIIRLTSDRGATEFMTINDVVGVGPNGEPTVENDITATKADFVVDLADYRKNARQAMFDQLFEMLSNFTQMGEAGAKVALDMLDLVMEMWDGPNKDEIVARIRKINGQPDPTQEGSPEAEQQRMAKEQAEAAAAALQQRAAEAEIALSENQALTARAEALLKKQQAIAAGVQNLQAAMQTSTDIIINPQMAAVMDQLIAYVNDTIAGEEQAITTPPAAPIAA
ncbi:MAG: hypothetical protein K2Y51_26045 [Gammaproteobacteria bacterium]|nr:hypothetical protein [Gammaproteobacteria bacterium]